MPETNETEEFFATIAKIQEYYTKLAPPEELWSEELIAERREEARREAEDE